MKSCLATFVVGMYFSRDSTAHLAGELVSIENE
jgi:hypothetical protein